VESCFLERESVSVTIYMSVGWRFLVRIVDHSCK